LSLPLLSTKFNAPSTGVRIVQRSRLHHLLNRSLEQNISLVLVCGPAGYGKTTIVSEWLHACLENHPDQFAWLTLEHSDDDLTRFLTYFVTALQHIHPGFGEGLLKLLQTHKPQSIPVLGTLVINELSEFPQRVIFVLDDYHMLTAEPIQNFVSFLVDHLPPQLCLVLVTRTDPALPLPRLRARGQLVELRQRELCFTQAETADFLKHTMGLILSQEQVGLLEQQTEGWISGLQLAAVSVRDVRDTETFFKAFSGEHEFIADYLTDEVLARLSEPLQSFLLQTSFLERLCAPLCEAVTGQPGAQVILEQLVDDNLFILPLDNQHIWYRYHILFADLLRKRIHTSRSEMVNELHQRASVWFEKNYLIDLAIEHAILGNDIERCARLIEQIAESLMRYGQAATLLRWLESLPEEKIITQPRLSALYGIAMILCSRSPDVVASWLEKIENSDTRVEFQGEMKILHALLAVLQGDARLAIQLSEQALGQLTSESLFFRSLAADTLGMGYTLAGDMPSAARAFEMVVEISRQTDNVMMLIASLTNLSGLRYVQGQLRSAINICQQVVELANQRIGRQSPIIGKTLLNLGEMLREQGNLESAQKYLQEAAQMMEVFSEVGLPLAYLAIARVKLTKKDWPAAQTYIDKARHQAQVTQSILMNQRLVDVMQLRYWIAHEELDLATNWAHERGFLDKTAVDLLAEAGKNAAVNEIFQAEYLTIIRLVLALQQPERALEMITLLQELVEKRVYQRRVIEILVLKSLALHQQGELDQALQTLEKAIAIAESEGYLRTFIDEREAMSRLLMQAAAHGIHPAYTSKLLAAINHENVTPAPASNSAFLIEPLSQRELEVLCLIAEGLSNDEIARRLYISLSTVKGHTTNIFGKLGVKNRTQAVAQARSLGLLPASKQTL
jgi:LuxR family maltose regulon positive regulatory protein